LSVGDFWCVFTAHGVPSGMCVLHPLFGIWDVLPVKQELVGCDADPGQ